MNEQSTGEKLAIKLLVRLVAMVSGTYVLFLGIVLYILFAYFSLNEWIQKHKPKGWWGSSTRIPL